MCNITVILPSLNVEKYIGRCLYSVCNQTLTDIEILCVDAGSTDGTVDVIRRYALKDPRIHFITSPRRSYGYQVNLGIKIAQGKYLSVVDTDDTIELDRLRRLYVLAEEYDCDTARDNFETVIFTEREYIVQKNDALKNCRMQNKYRSVLKMRDYSELPSADNYLWAGIYRTDFVRNHQIYLNETPGAATQDTGFMLKYLCVSKRAIYTPEIGYHYTINREEASMKNKKLLKYFQWEIQDLFQQNVIPEKEFNATRRVLNRRIFLSLKAISQLLYSTLNKEDEVEYILNPLGWFHNLAVSEARKGYLVLDDFPYGEQENIKDIIVDIDKYSLNIKKVVNELKTKETAQNNRIQELSKKGKSFILFGLGQRGRSFYFHHKDIRYSAFTDNNNALWNTRWDANDMEIIKPIEAVKRYPEEIYLIANKYYSNDICSQLCGYGIQKSHIIICDN